MSVPYFVPAADLLPYWPHDLLAASDLGIIGRLSQYVGASVLDLIEFDGEVTLTGQLALWEEIVLDLPLIDGVSLVMGQPGPNLTAFPFELSFGPASEDVAGDPAERALDLFLKGRPGPYELLLPQVDIGLRFDPEKLRPMKPRDPADLTKGFVPDLAVSAVQLNFRAAVTVNTETGVRLEAPGDLDLPYCQIGSTGVVISAQDLVFRLSDAQPFPEGIEPEAFDLEPDWKGIYLGRVKVFNLQSLCEGLPTLLDLEKWFLGRGGVTGKATATYELHPDMSERSFAVRAFRLALRQNALLEGLVQLAAKLSFFDDQVVYLDLQITNEPDLDFPESIGFMGAVTAVQPPDATVPRQDELLAMSLSHGDTPLMHLGVKKLGIRSKPDLARAQPDDLPADTRFWDILIDGRVEIGPTATIGDAVFGAEITELGLQVAPGFKLLLPTGLWLNMSEAARSRLAAFPVSISRVGFGIEGAEKWIGLDARVDFGTGLGGGAAVKGLRVYFDGPAGLHLKFDGIAVTLEKTGFSLAGEVSMMTGADPQGLADPADRIFRGDVLLSIASRVGIKIEGGVLFGTKSGTRFGYVALDATFGSGIPICSSVSWFGAALLGGINVAPDRSLAGDQGDNFNFYQHWYAPAPGAYSVTHTRKWAPREDAWALGAGVTIGSSDGKAWSLKALLAVIAPGPVIMLEGRLRLLKTRESHRGPPQSTTIRGLMVLDFDQGDFLLALELDYKLPDSGLLLDVHAAGEVFYGHRPRDWHLAIGWPEPLSRRVRAKALRLLEWDSYLVISGTDLVLAERTFPGTALAVGYRTGIDKRGKWGPVRGVLAVWIAGDVALSFRPFYILAELSLHGEASIKVFGIGFELMLDALLALEAPVNGDELFFGGKVTIKIGLPWPLPDIKKSIPFSWGDASALPPPITPLIDGASVSPGYSTVGQALYSRETGPVAGTVLPLDGRLSITFQRPMRSIWAGAPTPVDLAAPDKVGDVYYRYTLVAVRVRVTPAAGAVHAAAEDLFGQWTLGPGDAQGPQAESLVLWGLTPFPAAGNLGWPGRTERRSWADLLFDTYPTWPCGSSPAVERCVDFDIIPPGVYQPELRYRPDPARGAVIFTAWPNPVTPDVVGIPFGESVQVPLAIVQGKTGRCLQLARTTLIGGADGQKQGFGSVRDGSTFWGVTIDLPPCRHARGRVEHNTDLYLMFVLALMDGEAVAAVGVNGADFEIAADPKPAFNRVIIRLQPRRPGHPGASLNHLLCRFCYTTLGALTAQQDALQQRGLWLHVLGPLTMDGPETSDDPFGAHLVHEPHATYEVELDVQTESAEALDGIWQDHGIATERLTVSTAGAPRDLTPYVQMLVPEDGTRPVYPDYDLRITYNQLYVEAMYVKAGQALFAELFTANGELVEPEIVHSRTAQPAIASETAILLDRLQAADCVEVDVNVIAGFDETIYRTRLATSTAYEARILGGGLPQPVYRWSFVTSRYRNFAEQIADIRSVPWHERLPAAVDWAAVATRLVPSADRAAEDEAWRAIWQDHWGFPVRILPARPDVTLLWSQSSGFEASAISILSPEPLFGSERTTLVLKRKVTTFVLTPDARRTPLVSWHDITMRLVRSRDGARALIVPVDGGGQPVPLVRGSYRFNLAFRLTGLAGLPDFSRQGDTADETGSWPFTVPAVPDPIVDPEA